MSAWNRGPNDCDSSAGWFFGVMFFLIGLALIWSAVRGA